MFRVACVSPLKVHPTTWAAALTVVAVCVGAALHVGDRASTPSAERGGPWTREIAARLAMLSLEATQTPNRAKKEAREAVKQQVRLVPEIAALAPAPKPQPLALKPGDPSRLGATRRAPQDGAETVAVAQSPQVEAADAQAQTGRASWYALPGRRTASGEPMDHAALTAAHPSLPFGTKVRVVNLKNGRDVVVRINDRGPFAKNRIIDLSKAAATKLGMIGAGVARVSVHPFEDEVASNDDTDREARPVAR